MGVCLVSGSLSEVKAFRQREQPVQESSRARGKQRELDLIASRPHNFSHFNISEVAVYLKVLTSNGLVDSIPPPTNCRTCEPNNFF